MKELIKVLNTYFRGDGYQRPIEQAVDLLEAQAKEIEVLKIAHEAHQTSNLKMLAVLKQQSFDLEKRKTLCNQLGRALDGHCAPFLGHEEEHRMALEAWRESKCS